ncbi:MAG: helix-turn-helix domain-containing protein [Bacteroidetes bacterium]|nr:helix-turn-helix domain-containing protein [Bacteroidota bacterium]
MNTTAQKRYTITQAAKQSGMSQSWWRTQIKKGTIRYILIGKKHFIPESTLNDIVKVVQPETQTN